MQRRHLLQLAAAGSTTLAAPAWLRAEERPAEVRLDYAYYSPSSLVLRRFGWLEEDFKKDGIPVTWTFSAGSNRALEYLNGNSIDIGSSAGLAALLAKANGNPIRAPYIFSRPEWTALVVPKDSPLKSVADLKGRRIALNKGSNVHYFLVKLLEKSGLKYADVTPVFMPPADARAAFEKGAVDAWVIWDPFLSAVEKQVGARQIADATGVANGFNFYLAQTDYAQANPAVIRALLDNTLDAARFVQADVPKAAALIAPLQGLDVAVVESSLRRYKYGVVPVTPQVAAEQQKIADAFFELKLIPKAIRIADALPVTVAAK
jgi:sulfonate transport system substrate-binding protein